MNHEDKLYLKKGIKLLFVLIGVWLLMEILGTIVVYWAIGRIAGGM